MLLGRTIVAGVLVALSLAGVPSHSSANDRGVTVSAPWEITSVDLAKSGYVLLRMGIMETLVDVDAEGALKPGLATGWNVSEDGLTWTFAVRDGVPFHDGSALNAEIAVAALRRAKEQPGVLGKTPVTEIEAGDGAVVFSLDLPFAALPAFLAHYSTAIPASAAFDDSGAPIAAIGTGPFRVEALSPPQGLDVVRFDDYWGKAPKIASVQYLASGRAETRALLAESGDADLVFTLDPSGYARLEAMDDVEVRAVSIPRVVTLKINARHPFLAEPEARRALSMAIDRAGIAAGITRFPEAAATQLFPPILGDWHNAALEPLAHDPDGAKALLAGLGWKESDDGILTRNGERFSILLRTFPDRPELPLIAAALQDQFRGIGIELEVSVSSYSEIPAGHQDGSLHVALYARNYGTTPDPVGNALSDFGRGGGDWGAMNWDAPAVAEALATAAATTEPEARAAAIATAVEGIHDGLPLIPIVWYQHTVAVTKGLEGVMVDPLERTYGLHAVSWSE